jgi:hypothetical protein
MKPAALFLTSIAALFLATGAAHAQEGPDNGWPIIAGGDWECGKIVLRRTSQKTNNHGGWISFHLYSCDGKFCPALPRKITLKHEYDYDTHTDRVTINGKPCRQANMDANPK